MRKSRLPESGGNLFQLIKEWRAKAIAEGKTLINLAIGQPSGAAPLLAREAAAAAVMSEYESMHEYQDNGSPGVLDFARRFVHRHIHASLLTAEQNKEVSFLPIPGIKPMLLPTILACIHDEKSFIRVRTTTRPGYPTPADVCGYIKHSVIHTPIELNPANDFRFSLDEVDEFEKPDLIMLNYPHNPSGQTSSREWLLSLCGFCQDHNVRLFNDGAYTLLDHSGKHATLTDVALDFPDLSWMEMFSASKLGNLTGWRIGAAAGSPDFIGDLSRIKGNIDSGFFAPAAAGALSLLENGSGVVRQVRDTYSDRLKLLTEILWTAGMQLAVEPQAGFFSLWKLPKMAFGQEIGSAEHFNKLMIEHVGVVGVHFHPYIRYSVAQTDIRQNQSEISKAFANAHVSY